MTPKEVTRRPVSSTPDLARDKDPRREEIPRMWRRVSALCFSQIFPNEPNTSYDDNVEGRELPAHSHFGAVLGGPEWMAVKTCPDQLKLPTAISLAAGQIFVPTIFVGNLLLAPSSFLRLLSAKRMPFTLLPH